MHDDKTVDELLEMLRCAIEPRCAIDWPKCKSNADLSAHCNEYITCGECRDDLIDLIKLQVAGEYNRGFDSGFASADDWMVEHAEDMERHGWVKLPFLVGDQAETDSGKRGFVRAVSIKRFADERAGNKASSTVLFEHDDAHHSLVWYEAHQLHHVTAPTVEDVLRELIHKYDELRLGPNAFDPFELMADYAKRLRLREDGDAE